MNVFVRNIPIGASRKQTKDFFREALAQCGILYFHLEKLHAKPNAIITIATAEAALRFLAKFASTLTWAGKRVFCSKAHTDPSPQMVKSLAYDEQRAKSANVNRAAQKSQPARAKSRFEITSVHTGAWEYTNTHTTKRLGFISHFNEFRPGSIYLGSKEAIILLDRDGSDQIRIDINYRDCESIVLGAYEDPTISFDLRFPPKFYAVKRPDELASMIAAISLGIQKRVEPPKKERVCHISTAHARVVGSCFVYRTTLSDFRALDDIRKLLDRHKVICHVALISSPMWSSSELLTTSFQRLDHELTDVKRFGRRPFSLRFQVERLAKNGRLSPLDVLALLPKISDLYNQHGLEATCFTIRRFYRRLVRPGPAAAAEDCTFEAMQSLLDDIMTTYDANASNNIYKLSKRHAHINLIHKLVVTPTRIRLEGPEPEPMNRVLRKYHSHIDNFIRVVFQDEDGGSVRYDPRAGQSIIYHKRFKNVLDNAIIIAGSGYSFLGFSHSSLRSQTCWFMATMIMNNSLVTAENVLSRLGDFSKFRSPAKCAARIGQNFTDTNATFNVSPDSVFSLDVVERNGRDFSDGVGTISEELLHKVWRVYGSKRLLKPTALQIRFQGAKGMVSLDSRLSGERLMLRSNMKKFVTDATWNLEICGAAFRPLPMVLNKQFIKIFEDLGIGSQIFMDLQNAAIDRLYEMTESAVNAASFIDEVEVPKSTHLSDLLLRLHEIGLDYHEDGFLHNVIEMAILTKLRDMKYRGRIPVDRGVTLYGIMDETGFLKEGEIYVVTEKAPEGGKIVLKQNQVVVTRSPALHPGDIQLVNAVDVPETSPLKRLANVVVFSQYGARDLPSQLSGGDLDGDLYNIIYDERLRPRHTCQPADYPRVAAVELDRAVTRKDMSDFFVTFMESDQLGMLSNTHMQIADQLKEGTLHADCLKLASMASTAVDFSKTGIPVNLKEIPKHDRCRPDFMAPSPRVTVSKGGHLGLEEEDNHEDDDAFDGLDQDRKLHRFYLSEKVLGQLYRAIDERQFVGTMQEKDRRLHDTSVGGHGFVDKLLNYLVKWAGRYGVNWEHQTEFAQGVMASYYASIIEIAEFYEPSPSMPLTETEMFAGTILGRQGGAQNKLLRELCITMRTRFATVVDFTTMCIRKGNQQVQVAEDFDDLYESYDDREIEGLPRALACLHVAATEITKDHYMGELKSFRYIAAAMALDELRRYQITMFGTYSLPLLS